MQKKSFRILIFVSLWLSCTGNVYAEVRNTDDQVNCTFTSQPDEGNHPISRSVLLNILNTANPNSAEYQRAVEMWPDAEPIWPYLESIAAKRNFAEYIVKLDDTNNRPYQSFQNLCTGFATQFYIRYSTRSNIPTEDMQRLSGYGNIVPKTVPSKLKAPIFMATYPGHFFNAFLLDESKPDDINSYLILEPQNDQFIEKDGPNYEHYVTSRGVSMVDQRGMNSRHQYNNNTVRSFFTRGDGTTVTLRNLDMRYTLQDFFIAESGEMNYNHRVKEGDFNSFIRDRVKSRNYSDQDLVELGNILNGRMVRVSPNEQASALTIDKYLEFIGRTDLRNQF